MINAVLLLGVGALIPVEAARRLAHPETATPGLMVVFGVIALAGNAASLSLLRRGQGQSLNVRGAFFEVLSDFLGAAAVLVAAAVIADAALADGGGARVLDCLAGHFDVEHCTFQLEPASHRDHEHATHP